MPCALSLASIATVDTAVTGNVTGGLARDNCSMPKILPPLEILAKEQTPLRVWAECRSIAARLAQRARIVPLAGTGMPTRRSPSGPAYPARSVIMKRNEYAEGGLGALEVSPVARR
jgi:hypothetical protein